MGNNLRAPHVPPHNHPPRAADILRPVGEPRALAPPTELGGYQRRFREPDGSLFLPFLEQCRVRGVWHRVLVVVLVLLLEGAFFGDQ